MTAPSRRRRWPWILGALLVALPAAGMLALRAFVNPDSLRPRLVAAVEAATGRRFTVGDIGLALSLRPTLELRDVALANAPGGSRPEMLTARRVEVQAAILPLLSSRIEIARVVVEAPDLLLETDAEGRGNWIFHPAAPPDAPPPSAPAGPGRRLDLAIDSLRVEGGRVTWRDAGAGTAETAEIVTLESAAPRAGPTTARATLRARGTEAVLTASAGALAALGGPEPWPFDATAELPRGRARAKGALAAGGGWTAEVEARLASLADLAPLLPDLPLPPLRDLAFAGRLAGAGAAMTAAEALSLRVGDSDLSVLRPGLVLARLLVAAPRLDAPVTLEAAGMLGGVPLQATGSAGTPAQLLGQAGGALPLDLRLAAAGAEATVRGTVRDIRALSGVDLAIAAQVPDLAALAPLAGAPLPAIRDLRAEARLAERGGGFRDGVQLRGLALAAPPLEARGELALSAGERPAVAGRLEVARLDLDTIRAAMPARAAEAPAPAPSPPQAPPARDGRVIPDLPLPVGALRGFDADLRLAVATLTAGGAEWRDIQAPIRLQVGQGRIAPLSVQTPGGPVTAELAADASGAIPSLRVALRAPGLDMGALQQALGQPVRMTGHAELDADLRGEGAGLRAVAASLAGHLGLAMLDATVEPALLGPVTAALRSRAPVLPALPQRLPVDCVALRAEAQGGVAQIGTLLLDAPAAKVAGSGTVNLGEETLALRLLHDVRAAGASIRVAADLGGTLAEPAYRGVQAQNLGEVLGALGGRLGGDAGAILGALANRPGARPEPLPECGAALAAARGGRDGPVPAARAAPAEAAPDRQAPPPFPAAPQLPGAAGQILRGLLGR